MVEQPISTTGTGGASVTFVIPFWNEEAGVDQCISAIEGATAELERSPMISSVEFIAVDDGSTDGTAEALAKASARLPWVRVVTHRRNRGLGAALRTGLMATSTDWAFYTDADVPVQPTSALVALELARGDGTQFVSCIRQGHHREGLRRSLMSTVYNLAVRAVMRLPVRDVNAPAKLMHREVIAAAVPRTNSPFCDAEILARAIRSGVTISQVEVPAFARQSGQSSLSSPRVVAVICADLARHGWGLRVRRSQR